MLQDKSLDKVQAEATQAMTDVRKVLANAGIPDSDFRTGRYGVQREIDYKSHKFLGYSVTNLLTVKIRDFGLAGSIIDDVVAAGANEIGQLLPAIEDRRRYELEASRLATTDSLERARALAETAGLRLGSILLLSDVDEAEVEPRFLAARMMSAPANDHGTVIEAGTERIEAQVLLVVQLLE